MSTASLVLILILLILLSAYFSASETAFSSLNRIRLKNMAEKGKRGAKQALLISEDYDRLLSTLLVGNNIVNISSATLATILFTKLYGDMGATISTVTMTVLILIFGEISPKSLAKESPEQFAILSTPFLRILQTILTPINYFFSLWKRMLNALFQPRDTVGITEEELITIIDEVEEEGGLNGEDSDLIRSAIEFRDLNVEDIVTHRTDLVAIDAEMDMEEIQSLFIDHGFSRLPVYVDNIDNIVGILHEKDFFILQSNGHKDIRDYIKPPLCVPDHMKITSVMRSLQEAKTHLAVVVDEFGGTVGVVTLEDVLEELVGEIWDEHDKVVENIRKIDDHTCFASSNTGIDELFEFLKITKDPDDYKSNTVGGWVMEELGKLPDEGDSFVFEDWLVSITLVDERRVLEVSLQKTI